MDWLTGAIGLVGVGGLLTLGVLLYKMAERAGEDYRRLSGKLLTKTIRAKELEHALADRNRTLDKLQSELSRAHQARAEAEKALGDAMQKLSNTGTPTSVSHDIRGALSSLARLSGVSVPEAERASPPTSSEDR